MRKSIFICLCLMLAACNEREVYDLPYPDYQRKLVANCLINNESDIVVAVSYSVPSLGVEPPQYLENAVVEMRENGVLLGAFSYDVFEKKYTLPVKPQQGNSYQLTVTHPDFPAISATGQLPSSVQINNVVYIDSVGLDSSGDDLAAIRFTITDPGGDNNYYRLYFTYFNFALNKFLPVTFTTDDEVLLSPQTIQESAGSYLFTDDLFNGRVKVFELRFPQGTATSSPRYMVTVDALTQDYYRYRNSLKMFEDNKNNPFSEPVLIHTNVTGGLGIFAGYITERDTIQ